jgi:hypothetical protein
MAEHVPTEEFVLPEDHPAQMSDLLQAAQPVLRHPAELAQEREGRPDEDELSPPPEDQLVEPPPEEPAPPAVNFKYANQEEAEKAAREAAQRMHQVSEEAAFLRRQLEEAQVPPEPPTPAEPPPPEVTPPTVEEVMQMLQNGYKQARILDPNLDNFEDQQTEIVTRAQAEAMLKLMQSQASPAPQPTQPQVTPEEISRMVEAELQKERTRRLQSELFEMAASEGLDISAPTDENPLGGIHHGVFLAAINADNHLPGQEREAMRSVIDVTKRHFGITEDAATPPAPPASTPPLPPAPMERAGQGRPAGSNMDEMDRRPMHLSELLEMSQGSRTIRGQ